MYALALGLSLWSEPVPARLIQNGLRRSYTVQVLHEQSLRTYLLEAKVAKFKPKKPTDKEIKPQLQFAFLNYKQVVDGQEQRLNTMGGATFDLAESGLPGPINLEGAQGPNLLALLFWFHPGKLESTRAVPVSTQKIGPSLEIEGTVQPRDESAAEFSLKVMREKKPIGDLNFKVTLDPQGWPLRGTGTLVSADGTFVFKLNPK